MGGVHSVWWAHGHHIFYIYSGFLRWQTVRDFDELQWDLMLGSPPAEPMSANLFVAPQDSRAVWQTAHAATTSSTVDESVRLPTLGIIHPAASHSVFPRAGSKELEPAAVAPMCWR